LQKISEQRAGPAGAAVKIRFACRFSMTEEEMGEERVQKNLFACRPFIFGSERQGSYGRQFTSRPIPASVLTLGAESKGMQAGKHRWAVGEGLDDCCARMRTDWDGRTVPFNFSQRSLCPDAD